MRWAKPFSRELAEALFQREMRQARERRQRRLAEVDYADAVASASVVQCAKSKARYCRALAMRRQGKLLREIGAELGVSAARTRRIIAKAERAERKT